MKKSLMCFTILFLLVACKSSKTDENAIKENLLLQDNISNLLSANHSRILGVRGDYNSFKNYLDSLDNNKISSIGFALDYINTCVKPDTLYQDSIFLLFLDKFYSVANMLTDSFETKYNQLVPIYNESKETKESKAFLDNIKTCGLDIFMSEGMYYFDVTNDYFYNSFKNIGSTGLQEYLRIRKDELKEGFSEDAGMLISFDDLYKRVKLWEDFVDKYPTNLFHNQGKFYYEIYLETLMTGMDNTRTFDFNSDSLLPEVKSLYENIINTDSVSNTGKLITRYYDFLSRHSFRYNDSIDLFLESNGLSSMLGVQPHTR